VLRAAESGEDWKAVAAAHDIPYRTAYGWLMNGGQPLKRRGGNTTSKLNAQHVETMVSWLEWNPQLTLSAIRDRIEDEMGVVVTIQTVSNRLDGSLITLKKVHNLPVGVNTAANKLLRRDYIAQLLQLTGANKIIVYVDETNFNLFCRRTVGRALRGNRSVVRLPNSKGPNLQIIGAITSTGLLHWERRRGSFTVELFNAWLRRCLVSAIGAGILPQDVVVVIDNAPAHSRAQSVFQEPQFNGATLLRLAPYSPMLNAIETVWSGVKSHVKRSMETRFTQLLAGDPAGVLNQGEFRLQFLERCADDAMLTVTPLICMRSCNHVQQHYAGVLQLADMPVGQ
jgi:transposase